MPQGPSPAKNLLSFRLSIHYYAAELHAFRLELKIVLIIEVADRVEEGDRTYGEFVVHSLCVESPLIRLRSPLVLIVSCVWKLCLCTNLWILEVIYAIHLYQTFPEDIQSNLRHLIHDGIEIIVVLAI